MIINKRLFTHPSQPIADACSFPFFPLTDIGVTVAACFLLLVAGIAGYRWRRRPVRPHALPVQWTPYFLDPPTSCANHHCLPSPLHPHRSPRLAAERALRRDISLRDVLLADQGRALAHTRDRTAHLRQANFIFSFFYIFLFIML